MKLHICIVVKIIWNLPVLGESFNWKWTNVHCLLDSCHVTAWLRCHMTCWVGSPHSSYHPAKFVVIAPCESKDKIFLICHVITWSICYVLCGWGPFILSHHPAKFGIHRPWESGDLTSLICHVTTWWICYVTLWVGSLHPKSPSC